LIADSISSTALEPYCSANFWPGVLVEFIAVPFG